MAENAYPLPSSSVATQEQWLRLVRAWGIEDGVYSPSFSVTGSDLKATGNSSSNVAVAAGEGTVGGIHYINTASINVAVTTNAGGGSSRKDIIVLQADLANGTVALVYRTGSSSAFPALNKDEAGLWETEVAQVTVPAGSATVPPANVTPTRRIIAPHPVLGDGNWQPAAKPGQLLVEPTAISIGTTAGAWQQLYPGAAPTWTRPALQTGTYAFAGGVRDWNSGAGDGYYNVAYAKFADGTVRLRGAMENTSAKGVHAVAFILPTDMRPTATMVFPVYGSGPGPTTRVDINSDGTVEYSGGSSAGSVIWLDGISWWVG